MRKLALLVVLATLLTSSVARGAGYQTTVGPPYNGTILYPILDIYGATHPYIGPHLGPLVNLSHAYLPYASLPYANLMFADLAYANLGAANLSNSYLGGANFYGANLYGANLYDTSLENTNFNNANLAYANLDEAGLWGANLSSAEYLGFTYGSPYYYANTRFPTGFNPLAQGWIPTPFCNMSADADCDLEDINMLLAVTDWTGGSPSPFALGADKFDLFVDGILNSLDITAWLIYASDRNGFTTPYLRGDTDLDRNVDLADYNALATNFDPSGTYGPYQWQHGNSDGDDDIDLSDYNALTSNFQPLGYGAAAVPEPSSLVLFVAALLGVMVATPDTRRPR